MTYWVIAKIKDQIYCAADIRASGSANQNGSAYVDLSEKLFWTQYTTSCNTSIKIGICTSGFAAEGKLTIANILNDYIEYLKQQRPLLKGYAEVLNYLEQYLEKEYFSYAANAANLTEYIFRNTSFGIGMMVDGRADIGGHCSTSSVNSIGYQGSIESCYIDCSFSDKLLQRTKKQSPQSPPKDPRFGFRPLNSPLHDWMQEQDPIKLVTDVIFYARNTNHNFDKISEKCDLIAINQKAINKIYAHKHSNLSNVPPQAYYQPIPRPFPCNSLPLTNYWFSQVDNRKVNNNTPHTGQQESKVAFK